MRFPGSLTYCKIAREDFNYVKSRFLGNDFELEGTIQDINNNNITLPNTASAKDGYYVGCYITIISNDLQINGQTRLITAYNGTTKVATIDIPFQYQPKKNDNFKIYSGQFVPYNSLTLDEKIETIESEMNVGRFFKDAIYRGSRRVEGSLGGLELDYYNICAFIKSVFGKEAVTLEAGNVYKHTFEPEENPLIQLPSLSVQLFKKNLLNFNGVFVKSIKFNAEVDSLLKADIEFLGIGEEEEDINNKQNVIYYKAPSFKYYEGKLRFRANSQNWIDNHPLYQNYVELPIDRFELTYDNGIEYKHTFKGMEEVVYVGEVASSTMNTVTLNSNYSNKWNVYNNLYLQVYDTSTQENIGVIKKVISYDPLTATLTLDSNFEQEPLAQGDIIRLLVMNLNVFPYSIDRKMGTIELSIDNDLDDLMKEIRSEYKNDNDCEVEIKFVSTEPIASQGNNLYYGELVISIPRLKISEYNTDINGTEFVPANLKFIGLAPKNGQAAISIAVKNLISTPF